MPMTTDWRNAPDLDADQEYTYGIMALTVGIPEVTVDNVEEFWRRVNSMESLTGPFRRKRKGKKMKPYLLTQEEAKTLVGFKTNVTPMSKVKFRNHLWSTYERLVSFK